MQPNEIVLAVDEANDATTVNHTYTRQDYYLNRSLYISSTHANDARDTLGLYRTYAKASGNFKGVNKSSIKFTKDIVVPGVDGVSDITSPMILEVSFSLPVGFTAAQSVLLRQHAVALLDRDDVMAPLNDVLTV